MTKRALKRNQSSRLRVVCYHDLADESAWTRGLNVSTSPERFERQIKYLSQHYDLISPGDLVGELPRRPLLVTFDDAYRSVIDVGLPVLSSFNVAALFFVATDPVYSGLPLVDNVYAFAASRQVQPKSLISSAEPTERFCVEEQQRDHMLDQLGMAASEFMTEVADYISHEDLKVLSRHGWQLGGHTASHCVLHRVPTGLLSRQIAESMGLLSGFSACRSFAVPYGRPRDLTPAVARILAESGVSKIFLTTGRANLLSSSGTYYRTTVRHDLPSALWRRLEVYSILKSASPRGVVANLQAGMAANR